MTKVHIEVKKNTNENSTNLIRRFSRKVIESGIIQKIKGERYAEREMSKLSQKKVALRRIIKRRDTEKLKKLGKIIEKKR